MRNYVIEIIHLNGNKQIRKSIDPSNYNLTMQLYREIKEDYTSANVTINFICITDEERRTLFTKKNREIENNKKDLKLLIETLYDTAKELENKLTNIYDNMQIMDKKKSGLEHLLIEAIDVETLDDVKKIETFNKLREVTLERRDYKVLNQVKNLIAGDVQSIKERSNKMLDDYEQTVNKNSSILNDLIFNDESKLKEVHTIKELRYKNHKERINIMKQINGKYDKVVNDENKKVLMCYNKCIS